MNGSSSMILIGVGGAGCGMAQDVARVFGDGVKLALLDNSCQSIGNDLIQSVPAHIKYKP